MLWKTLKKNNKNICTHTLEFCNEPTDAAAASAVTVYLSHSCYILHACLNVRDEVFFNFFFIVVFTTPLHRVKDSRRLGVLTYIKYTTAGQRHLISPRAVCDFIECNYGDRIILYSYIMIPAHTHCTVLINNVALGIPRCVEYNNNNYYYCCYEFNGRVVDLSAVVRRKNVKWNKKTKKKKTAAN